MKMSQWCQAVENRCVFSAHLKVLSDRSGDHSASGRRFHVAGPLTAKLCCPVVQSGRVEPVECQSLQITDADDLRWQYQVRRGRRDRLE